MTKRARLNEVSNGSMKDWNDFCRKQFHRQGQSAGSSAPQSHFVECYLAYWQQNDDPSAEKSARKSYESIILKAQQDARKIIRLAKTHEARILRDAQIEALSDRAQLRMQRAFG